MTGDIFWYYTHILKSLQEYCNYNIKNENIISKDYVTRTLIEYSKSIKKYNIKHIIYDTFKYLQKDII